MDRRKWIQIAIVICVVVIAVAVVLSVSGLFGWNGSVFANAERYTAGDAVVTGNVKNLDIHWTSGKVRLAYHSGSGVELRETSDRPIGDDLKMRWWLDGDTLRVQYAKSGLRMLFGQQKELTVTLPEGITLGSVNIEATSADVDVPDLRAEDVNMTLTSGNVRAVAETARVSAGTTSGEINLEVRGRAEAVSAGSTSGNIRLTTGEADAVSVHATSGDIQLTGDRIDQCKAGTTSGKITAEIRENSQMDAGSTSGDIRLSLERLSALKAGATSGRITLTLPQEPGFTATIETVSGSIDSSLPLTRNGNRYVCGDGSGKVEIGTTSGNIELRPAEGK